MLGSLGRRYSFAFAIASVAFVFTNFQASAQTVYKGKFVGLSGHKTSGNITIRKTSRGYVVNFQRNFRFDGAPDPRFGFGKNGRYSKSTTFSRLKSNRGAQSYRIPRSVKLGRYNEFYLWCKKFSVPLGKVKLVETGKGSSRSSASEEREEAPRRYRGSF